MADICIIYSRRNPKIPKELEKVLSPRWSVWWDNQITGDFRTAIEEALRTAKCVIPVWSSDSRDSNFVPDEADFAQCSNVPLIPVKISANVRPPIGFGGINTIDISGWRGGTAHPGIVKLIAAIEKTIPGTGRPLERNLEARVGKSTIKLPALFYSVSSHETQLTPEDAVRALGLFGAKTILVSAYDTGRGKKSEKTIKALKRCKSAGATILLDSGNYEASRRGDKLWKQKSLQRALEDTPHDWAFCFDSLNPSNDPDKMFRSIIAAVKRDANFSSKCVLPIVHAPRLETGEYDLSFIPEVIKRVASELRPPLVAIPERELGPGIIARAQTVNRIRKELDTLGFYQPLHLLGTGNPLSIAVLAAAGSDSFDGLEWYRVAADASDGRLYHYQHFDFFRYQSEVAQSKIVRAAVSDTNVNYRGKVAFHNLEFFSQFIDDLQTATAEGKVVRFLSELLPKGSMEQLEQALKGLL